MAYEAVYFFIMTYVNAAVVAAELAVQGALDRPALHDFKLATPDANNAPAMTKPEIKLGFDRFAMYPATPSAPTTSAHGNVRQKSCLGTQNFIACADVRVNARS
jgi:hypothetical protein